MTTSVWLLLCAVLLVAELLSGTFFLLLLSIASAVGACGAWLGLDTLSSSLSAMAVALLSCLALWHWRQHRAAVNLPLFDLEHNAQVHALTPVSPDGMLRVRYRGSEWDAQLIGAPAAENAPLYIVGRQGNQLKVAAHSVHP